MSQKRVQKTKPKVIVCDIEGTTTSVNFWGQCLVPFIKYNTNNCLKDRWDSPLLQELVDNLRNSTAAENEKGANIPAIAGRDKGQDLIIRTAGNNIISQMNEKRYGKSLQHIQLYIWLFGYQSGELKGHIFEDVARAFNTWSNFMNIKIYSYSSGVYLTQRLLFACSVKGNLSPLIKNFLDVESYGPKVSGDSYSKIASTIGCKTKEMLFISDNPKELSAARQAGCDVLLAIRPNNKELTDEEIKGFESIESFDEIKFT